MLVNDYIIIMTTTDQYFMALSVVSVEFSSIVSCDHLSQWNCDGFDDFSSVMSPDQGKSRRGVRYHVYLTPLFDLP